MRISFSNIFAVAGMIEIGLLELGDEICPFLLYIEVIIAHLNTLAILDEIIDALNSINIGSRSCFANVRIALLWRLSAPAGFNFTF